jgi:hypothetical protein
MNCPFGVKLLDDQTKGWAIVRVCDAPYPSLLSNCTENESFSPQAFLCLQGQNPLATSGLMVRLSGCKAIPYELPTLCSEAKSVFGSHIFDCLLYRCPVYAFTEYCTRVR